jgi:poly(3-hydroxyalkanoate) synthetase
MAARTKRTGEEIVGKQGHLHEPIGKPDKAAREEILRALEEWLADESGYDEKVWPELKRSMEENRLSSRKRFRD